MYIYIEIYVFTSYNYTKIFFALSLKSYSIGAIACGSHEMLQYSWIAFL